MSGSLLRSLLLPNRWSRGLLRELNSSPGVVASWVGRHSRHPCLADSRHSLTTRPIPRTRPYALRMMTCGPTGASSGASTGASTSFLPSLTSSSGMGNWFGCLMGSFPATGVPPRVLAAACIFRLRVGAPPADAREDLVVLVLDYSLLRAIPGLLQVGPTSLAVSLSILIALGQGCRPCPDEPQLLLHAFSAGGFGVVPPEPTVGAAILVPPVHRTFGAVLCAPETATPTGAIGPSRDSGEMSSHVGWSSPPRFHCTMGSMSGSTSCSAASS